MLFSEDAGGAAPPLSDGSIGTQADFCTQTGPPRLVDSTAEGGPVTTCPDDLAQRAFRYALCTCGAFTSGDALVTDAFDGTRGAYAPATVIRGGGSVGFNGPLHPGPMQIGGSLWASLNSAITTTSPLDVAGDLHVAGEFESSSSLTVEGDAWLGGGIQTTGALAVSGALHVPLGTPDMIMGIGAAGPSDTANFSIPVACDCNPGDFVDIKGVVETYKANNDDVALGISPGLLDNVQSDPMMTLPCGRIFLADITSGQAPIHLTAGGRVAIFVEGDLSTTDFIVDAPDGTEVDLFVGGSITVSGAFQVGSPENPARARTYVGGSSVNLQGAATLAGNLYAPFANLTLGTQPTTAYGSLFINALNSQSGLAIHYDEAILSSSSCASQATCNGCNDCSNGLACVQGRCGQCVDSADCCLPLVCGAQHACVANVVPR